MSYKYMLLDSRGAPVAQGVSEDGPEKNVWQLRIAHGDIKRVLGHEYISLVGTSEQFPAMEGRIVRCRDNLLGRVGAHAGGGGAPQPAHAGAV